MNDATPWIDPELVAAGRLLQSRGLVAPDRTQAPLSEVRAAVDRIGAFLCEGSVPLRRERDLSLPGPHGQVPCRLYLPDDAERPPGRRPSGSTSSASFLWHPDEGRAHGEIGVAIGAGDNAVRADR